VPLPWGQRRTVVNRRKALTVSDSIPPDPSLVPPAAPAPESVPPPPVADDSGRRRIRIGSQRDPAAYRPRRRDWVPVEPPPAEEPVAAAEAIAAPATAKVEPLAAPAAAPSVPEVPPPLAPVAATAAPAEVPAAPIELPDELDDQPELAEALEPLALPVPVGKIAPPTARDRLTPDLESELSAAMGDAPLDELLLGAAAPQDEAALEPESRQRGRVLAVRRGEVFLELGGREQGCLKLAQLSQPPQVGDWLDVVVRRFNAEDGLYEVSLPNVAASVEDWSDLAAGMIVEARVTGHNTGGLECEVNHIRGFIPISQIALYRVEGIEQFVGQQFTCVITEANPERRNLVLSRRAMLEREREQARQEMLASLEPGQVREGTVRKLMPFGAFVDLGGVEGLLHVSQLAWFRVNHPSEILAEGQKIQIKIEKVDAQTGKIRLAYRELQESPWARAAEKYPANSVQRGKVTKLMEFGAFVALEPGCEGLVHISELSHKRVWRASDVVKEGDEVEVLVLAMDAEAQRISLSMKALAPPPKAAKKPEEEEPPPAEAPPKRRAPDRPLGGGLGRRKGGDSFGLKW